jgi:predicted Co/Zn/Cd cation transporter (cation efflux family)
MELNIEKFTLMGLFAGLTIGSLSIMFAGLSLLNASISVWALKALVIVGLLSAVIYSGLFIWIGLKYKSSK